MPARIKSLQPICSDIRETLSHKYDVTQNGFLPASAPLKRLANPYYAPWEFLAQHLPALLREYAFRDVVAGLRVLDTDKLRSEEEWRRAYVILVFLAHGYIWGGETPSDVLPPQITVPLLQVSQHFDLPPTATYAGLVLWNFESTCDDFGDLDALQAVTTFTGTEDESWFYMLSVALEAQTAGAIPAMVQALEATHTRDYDTMYKGLGIIIDHIKKIDALLERMYEKCDPILFYSHIRPWLAGSMNMEEAGLPNGVFYDEGDGRGEWKKLMGGSNGQSSIIQFLDIALGVEHTGGMDEPKTCPVSGHAGGSSTAPCPVSGTKEKVMGYHEQVLAYMPEPHRRFLKSLARIGSVQSVAMAPQLEPEHKKLQELHEAACRTMGDFRKKHIQVVTRYIIIPSTKKAAGSGVNLASASSKTTDGSELRGTGGTSLRDFLKQSRDETYRAGCLASQTDATPSATGVVV